MLYPPDSIDLVEREQLDNVDVIIDVRSFDAYQQSHIKGAVNLCVYENAFIVKVSDRYPDLKTSFIVYGDSDRYRGADYAFSKLKKFGYECVRVLKGGLDGCIAIHDARVQSTQEKIESPEGFYAVDLNRSRILWFGRNYFNQHNGTVSIKSGSISVDAKGAFASGELTVNMEDINCCDLSEKDGRTLLIEHLKSSDFFDVKQYPLANFHLRSFEEITNASRGRPNLRIRGELEIKSQLRSIELSSMFYPIEDGFGLQAQFDFDRSRWNVLYGSGSVFEKLGMHLISDLVSIQIQLFFTRGT